MKTINFGESFLIRANVDWKLQQQVVDALKYHGFDPSSRENTRNDDYTILVRVEASTVSSAHSVIDNIVRG